MTRSITLAVLCLWCIVWQARSVVQVCSRGFPSVLQGCVSSVLFVSYAKHCPAKTSRPTNSLQELECCLLTTSGVPSLNCKYTHRQMFSFLYAPLVNNAHSKEKQTPSFEDVVKHHSLLDFYGVFNSCQISIICSYSFNSLTMAWLTKKWRNSSDKTETWS